MESLLRCIEALSVDCNDDNEIKKILVEVSLEGKGIQNQCVELLCEKKLRFYRKRDLGNILKDLTAKHVKSYNELKGSEEPRKDELPYLTITNEVFENFDIITLKDSDQIMICNSKCYRFDISSMQTFISNRIRYYNVSHKHTLGDVIDCIKKSTQFDRELLNYDSNFILFRNGIFNLDTEKFTPNSEIEDKAWHFFFEIPHDYKTDKEYRCPKFKFMLRQWLSRPFSYARCMDVFESMGLCMTTNTGYKTSFMTYGPKNSGKTRLFNIVKFIIGTKNMTAISLQRIVKNEFGTVRLQFKLLNYCGDLGSGKIWDTGIFKNLTGGDELVGAEIKGGNSFEFQPTAKFWFNANKIPAVEDINDDAFFDRFVLYYFGNTFTKDNIDDFQIDYHKIITRDPEEIQGIIHECIKGLIRLKKRKGFRTKLKEKTKHIWNYESDPIYAYIYDYCIIDKNAIVEVEILYRDYATHCKGVPRSKNIITKNLERYGVIKGKAKKENDKGERPQCYFGIKLKHEGKEEAKEINIDTVLAGKITETKKLINDF